MQAQDKTRGRKPIEEGKRMTQRMVTIDEEAAEILKAYGKGNLSQGIRAAAKSIAAGQFTEAQVSQ